MFRDWQEHGSAYEVVRVLTAPARRGLIRLRVEHPENLPADGPAIIVANHVSFFDSVLLMFALPRPVAVLGKAEYTDRRITNWLFCGAGMIPVRRENPGDLPRAFDQVGEVLDRGEIIGVFPEGTRSLDGLLHRGHSGAAHLALKTGAPLIPVGIIGTDQIMPTGTRIVRPFRRATIDVGEPIDTRTLGFTKSTNRARREVTDALMAEIQRLCGQEYVDHYAHSPTSSEHARMATSTVRTPSVSDRCPHADVF
jgi:1-acyl-sn-glycerol-3-phosphate acyltransferase